MDIRSFFSKKSSGGAAKKTKVANADTITAEVVAPAVKRAKEEAKNMKGFESSDDEDYMKAPAKPSPKKKPRQRAPSPPKKVASPPKITKASTPKINHDDNTSGMKKRTREDEVSKPTPPAAATTEATPTRKSPKKLKTSPAAEKVPLLEAVERDGYDLKKDNVVSECLMGLTFCLTGILEDLHRDDAIDLLKSLGAKVTGAVSGRTSYVVAGSILEDGRSVEEGRKYKDAVEKGTRILQGARQLYGICHQYQERSMKAKGVTKESVAAQTAAPPVNATAPATANPYSKKPVAANPYAKKAGVTSAPSSGGGAAVNPYAKKTNPYGKPATAASTSASTSVVDSKPGQLWVDRHAPKNTRDILGNADNVRKLTTWLNVWERTFNKPAAYGKAFSAPKGPWKAALLSGPPGIGKTTTATLVAKEAGRDLREFNASDARSKKALQQQLGDLTGSQSLGFSTQGANPSGKKTKQLRCIIMDEVDGMGAGDRGGTQELIQMIKKSKVPIICICNDRQAQNIKSLVPYCMDLRFKRPNKSVMANRAVRVAQMEGMNVERNAAEAIAESCGNDVRQILNVLQMWSQKKGSKVDGLSYQTLKEREGSINKDEILRVGLFDAAKTIMEGRAGLSGADSKAQVNSLYKRSDAFFVDYSFTGLLVQQNYTKVMNNPWGIVKKADNNTAESKFLDRMHDAALSMSDYAMFEHGIRGSGDQNWGLLPATGMMAVKTGYHAGGKTGGFLGGFPEFTAWLGKNSSKGKKLRILSELHHHMNYKVSADSQQLRESYLPVFRERFLQYFRGEDRSDEANDEAIALMDDYGLSREDVMEKLDEFKMSKDKGFADLDSKQKAAFTRRWNQGSHQSQALVAEELGLNKPKKAKAKRKKDPNDMDAIDEDGDESESESEDEEAELKKIAARLGKKRGKKGKAPTKKATGKK